MFLYIFPSIFDFLGVKTFFGGVWWKFWIFFVLVKLALFFAKEGTQSSTWLLNPYLYAHVQKRIDVKPTSPLLTIETISVDNYFLFVYRSSKSNRVCTCVAVILGILLLTSLGGNSFLGYFYETTIPFTPLGILGEW